MRRWKSWVCAAMAAAVFLSGCGSGIFVGTTRLQEAEQTSDGYLELPPPAGLNAPQSPLANPFDREVINPPAPAASVAYTPSLLPTDSRAGFVGGQYVPFAATAPGPAFAWADTENFLVLGTDRRGSEGSWRTDTIMVVGLDRANNRAAVLSVPRDLYIEIPGYGMGRINQVDYIGEKVLGTEGGGPALVSQVLNTNLGITTEHWARVEMSGFKSLVDAVGGVTIYLDCPFYEPIYNVNTDQWEYFTLPAGDVWMDGETAYWFVRLRLRESDIGRAKRQRQFLWALRDQALRTNLLVRFPELWSAFRETFSTDLSVFEMADYLRVGLALDAGNVRATGISLADLQSYTTEGGASVLRIIDPVHVQNVVNGVWDAPAMVDAYRQDASQCPAIPADVQAQLGIPAEWQQTQPPSAAVAPEDMPEDAAAGAPTGAPGEEADGGS